MAQHSLTTGEAARLLGVTPVTVRRWIDRGLLQDACQTPGGHWRIPRKAVERMIDRSEAGGSDGHPGLGPGRALLFVRVPRDEHQALADQALVHLAKNALALGCQVAEIVREIGSGMNGSDGQREGLERTRRLVRDGEIETILVERLDRLMVLGHEEFVRWAKEHGVAVVETGVCNDEAEQVYAMELLEDMFYPVVEILLLAGWSQGRAEQAAAWLIPKIMGMEG